MNANKTERNRSQDMSSGAKWKTRWERLASMDRAELANRSRRALAARMDALRFRLGADFANGMVGGPTRQRPRFFFMPKEISSLCAQLKRRLPAEVDEIVRRAERICQHRFDLLGYEDLDYGDRIDWHCDRVHGKRAPRKPWFLVRYLDFGEVGDSKVTWELNRHQHMVILAKAYRLTENQRFAEEIFQQWNHWHAENPYPIGINWTSSLEVAFRSLSWLWVNALIGECAITPAGFREEWLRAMAINGRHIERYPSTYFSPNTHLLGEGVALFFIGSLCPELRDAERWKQKGWQIVLREAERQVRADGFHFEQSVYYHVYALDFFLHATVLATLNGATVPREFEETLEKMFTALLLLCRSGAPPRLGDDDGGRVFDPARNRSEHMLDPLATGAVLFARGDFKAGAGELREETIWLLGEQGVAEWDRLEKEQPIIASTALEMSGLYVLTAPRSELVINADPQGAHSAGHGHADALSISLQSNGNPLLIDAGTLEYVGDGSQRDLFRSTSMHNTLCIDGTSQSEPSGPFSWRSLAHGKVERWIQGETFDLFVGSHNGYARLRQPAIHRRWLVALKSGLFLVRDFVEGEGNHRLDVSWHLAPEVQMVGDHLFRVKGASHGLAVLPAEGHGWSEVLRKDFWSPVYGKKQTITVLDFGKVMNVPAEFVTLLVPLHEAHKIPGRLVSLGKQDVPSVSSYRYEAGAEERSFFFSDKRKPWKQGSLSSDAEFVCWRQLRGTGDDTLILCNGTYVEIEDRRVLTCNRVVTRCEVVVHEGSRQIFCSDPDAVEENPVIHDKVSEQASSEQPSKLTAIQESSPRGTVD
jgi:hypothetical protein